MILSIEQLVPLPLKDKLLQRRSDVWNRSLAISDREWVKIKAPSGTGKTTLVQTLYRLRTDYQGTVMVDGHNLQSIGAQPLATLRQQVLSVVFQDLRLFPHLTARENIELKRVLTTPLYEATRIDEMAAALQVQHVLDQPAGICSYGEQQRIAIIRALMQPFRLLLLDEPFSHLDNHNMQKAAALIADECRKRDAALLITDLEDDDHFPYTSKLEL